MSSGAALSTPREHLTNIENALKTTGLFAATARIGIGAAGKAYPLGSLLTSTGLQCPPRPGRAVCPWATATGQACLGVWAHWPGNTVRNPS